MGRGKTQIRRIENKTSRQVTFSKRRTGIMKKAFELSVLCDVEVALIIFSPRGKLFEFASSSMQATIERYKRHTKGAQTDIQTIEQNMQDLKDEVDRMMNKIEFLEHSKRKLLGDGLESCSFEELRQIEQRLEWSLTKIRSRKSQVFEEQIHKLKQKEVAQSIENAELREKEQNDNFPNRESSPGSNVETQLFIGLPETRVKRFIPRLCL